MTDLGQNRRPTADGQTRPTTEMSGDGLHRHGQMGQKPERAAGRAGGLDRAGEADRLPGQMAGRRRRYIAEAGQWRRTTTQNPTQQSKNGRTVPESRRPYWTGQTNTRDRTSAKTETERAGDPGKSQPNRGSNRDKMQEDNNG